MPNISIEPIVPRTFKANAFKTEVIRAAEKGYGQLVVKALDAIAADLPGEKPGFKVQVKPDGTPFGVGLEVDVLLAAPESEGGRAFIYLDSVDTVHPNARKMQNKSGAKGNQGTPGKYFEKVSKEYEPIFQDQIQQGVKNGAQKSGHG